MAKAKAKAVAGEVWALRFLPPDPGGGPFGPLYMLYPFKPAERWCDSAPDKDAAWMSTLEFERLFPHCVLEPGGGPVQVM